MSDVKTNSHRSPEVVPFRRNHDQGDLESLSNVNVTALLIPLRSTLLICRRRVMRDLLFVCLSGGYLYDLDQFSRPC